jgi:WS/DGAT/MGAT family acyltransferase
MSKFAPPEKVALLLLESSAHPMHLGMLEMFRPSPDAGPNVAREIYEQIRCFRDVSPLFSGHPAATRRGTSRLRWVHDDHVDIDYHVRYVSLPAPGGRSELFTVVNDLHSRLLDRRRPLWECHIIDGLDDGRFALYLKMHHAMTDGVSGAKTVQANLSADPEDKQIRVGWTPQPRTVPAPPSERAPKAKSSIGVRRSVALMRAALRERELIPAMRAPRTIFNTAPGGPRRCAAQTWPNERIKNVARAAGTTVNDVAVAMCAGALRGYLSERGELPDASLVAMVPVNLRSEEDDQRANVIGAAVCNLATDVDDPAKRLAVIHASMQRNVQIIREMPQQLAIQLAGVICAPISSGTGLGARIPPVFTLGITHVRGRTEPLYWGGARLEGMYPMAPTLRGQALTIGLFSRAEGIDFGIAASAAAVPDPERIIDHLETALKDLELAVGV